MICIICDKEMEPKIETIKFMPKSITRLKRPPVSKKKRIVKKVKKRWGTITKYISEKHCIVGYTCSSCRNILNEGVDINSNYDDVEKTIGIMKKYIAISQDRDFVLPKGYSFP